MSHLSRVGKNIIIKKKKNFKYLNFKNSNIAEQNWNIKERLYIQSKFQQLIQILISK